MIRRLFAVASIVLALMVAAGALVWLWLWPDLHRLDDQIASARNAPVHARIIPAIVAMEDPQSFQRSGVPTLVALGHALMDRPSSKRVYCASTLTDQFVRMSLPSRRAATRIVKEVLLTTILEARSKPDDVAQAYARLIHFGRSGGRSVIGAREAALAYFGRPAEELSADQIATLISAISNPVVCSPSATSAAAIDRRLRVLAMLRERRVIGADEFETASQAVARRRL